MSQQELLKKVIQALDQSGIQYMITGSVVSSLQGEPRSTHDIDLVIAIEKSNAHKLVGAFPPPDFYLDQESVIDAINQQSMFNLIDVKEGYKVDFWVLTNDPFDQSRFSRRYNEELMGLKLRVSSPEDTILAKLRWAKLSGGSEKHFTDALRVYEVQYGKLDMNYLEYWAKRLDVESLWKRLKDEAETI
jgi:hypothetical protein